MPPTIPSSATTATTSKTERFVKTLASIMTNATTAHRPPTLTQRSRSNTSRFVSSSSMPSGIDGSVCELDDPGRHTLTFATRAPTGSDPGLFRGRRDIEVDDGPCVGDRRLLRLGGQDVHGVGDGAERHRD